MILMEELREAIDTASEHLGVLVLDKYRLENYLFLAWGTRPGRNYLHSIAHVENYTTAQEFRALEFTNAIAHRLDIELHPWAPPSPE